MSISSRISLMEEHVTNAYNGLAGLGADLTGIDKNIDNIASVLDDIYDSMPQVSGEGTSLTLDDTRVGKIKSTLKGNTSQTTYSGKNLANTKITNWNYLGVSVSYDEGTQILTINGTSTGNASLSFGSYNFSPISVSSGERLNLVVKYVSGSATSNDNGRILLADENYTLSMAIPLNGINTDKSEYKNINSNLNYNILQFGYKNGDVYNNLKIKIMVCKGSDIDYEPYTGGTPSPNPSYPQPVNVVSGDNEINVVGKNLFNKADYITDSWSSAYNGWKLNLEPGTYTLSANVKLRMIKGSEHNSSGWGNVKFGSGNANANTFTFSISENFNQYLWMSYTDSGGNEVSITKNNVSSLDVQLEKGSSASSYLPYSGNTYNIDLPEGMELCSSQDGTKRDYFLHDKTLDKWYLHKEIGKVVLNGSESGWSSQQMTNNYAYQLYIDDMKPNSANSALTGYLVNLLSESTPSAIWGSASNTKAFAILTDKRIRLTIGDATDKLNDFKTFLSSNNLLLYYALLTPTTTEITYQPLIDQLNLLEKAMSKNGKTNISQVNNDLPFIISASALKEWQENTSLNSTLSMVNPLSLGNTLNTQQIDNNTQPIEVDNIEPLEEEENEES